MKDIKLKQIGTDAVRVTPERVHNIIGDMTIGDWFHLELMHDNLGGRGTSTYWMNISGSEFHLFVDGNGRVSIAGLPGAGS